MGRMRTRVFIWLSALATVLVTTSAGTCDGITIIGTVTGNGYQFINFDGPAPNTGGTTINGISNNGTVVGFTTAANGNLTNFTGFPQASAATLLNINGSMTAMANGINSAGTVVGADGNGNAFTLQNGVVTTFIPGGGTSAMAFGINDKGQIVGQYATATATPGFIRSPGGDTTINAPSGAASNVVNAQGINNNGQVVGFYLGNDGQVHGFMANAKNSVGGILTGTAVADPVFTPVEPGATFVFSQILGVNDKGLAAGYYQDSTASQHGYLYDTNTGKYTFLDDPSAAFNGSGVEVTQITGISNAGEITGFYTDANGVAHGFIAFQQGVAVPEPGSLVLAGIAVTAALGYAGRRARRVAVD
jgi:probable HAF family extracellular repeat protein